jgi:energy-coupling factor transport system ATP-binding protein
LAEPVVDIQKLSFTYSGSLAPALQDINLQVYPGEFLTITGPSGCGKSTLALCLAGFIPHSYPGRMEGLVSIQGRNTRDYPAGGLSGIVGLVQQDPEAQLCTLTVRDEIAFGPENLCVPAEEIRERINYALQAVGALELIDRQVHTLSGGEKQRVAIASVLAMNPSLLILDEPTANLDPFCTVEVLDTLKQLRKQNISIIVIEHRLKKLVSVTNRLLVMGNGKIVGESTSFESHRKYLFINTRTDLQQGKAPNSTKKNQETPLLSVKNLRAGYEGRNILAGISFSAYAGETIAIMGNNGSGKTTLLLALLGVLKADEGTITLQDEDISKLKVTQRAQDIGLTFQNPNHQIFENTVVKEAQLASLNLSKNSGREIERIVDHYLEKFDLWHYKNNNPFTLSLGEKKRLTLVSILAYNPSILILDEPLVGQDSDRLDLLMAALHEHSSRGGITLMVCHEPDVVASNCHRVLFLSEGKLVIDAPVNEALVQLAQMGMEEYLPSRHEFCPQVKKVT